jgi:ankyrin repeat protein
MKDVRRRTALHYAALANNAADVERLLIEGFDAGAKDDQGWTPLHFAAQNNVTEAARCLLAAGAPIDARDSNGNTPLFRAVFNSQGCGDLINLFRAHGANPHVENDSGISPLQLARTIANFNVAQFFSDLGEE